MAVLSPDHEGCRGAEQWGESDGETLILQFDQGHTDRTARKQGSPSLIH